MTTGMWLSITTTDLERARTFYEALGFPVDPAFTGDTALCLRIEDNLRLMVMPRDVFATMTDKVVADPQEYAQFGLNITRDSREDVDAVVERGLAAGGTEPQPAQDHGFMYARDLADPDGNNVGFLFMAESE